MFIGALYSSKHLLDAYTVILCWVHRDGSDTVGRNQTHIQIHPDMVYTYSHTCTHNIHIDTGMYTQRNMHRHTHTHAHRDTDMYTYRSVHTNSHGHTDTHAHTQPLYHKAKIPNTKA